MGEVDTVSFIGKYEFGMMPQSLVSEDGFLWKGGTKSTLVKSLAEGTKLSVATCLPQEEHKTAVMIDAMYNIQYATGTFLKVICSEPLQLDIGTAL